MYTAKQPTLEFARMVGRRVELRPLSVSDVATAFALVHERREITDWLIWDGPESPEEMVPWYESWADCGPEGANYHFAICERESGAFCGSVGVRFGGHEFQGDLGYWLALDKWGRGYMTEAVGMVVWLSFERLRSQLVYALAFDDNVASARVLEKCHFQLDPAGSAQVEKRGEPRVEEFFGLSRSRWERAGCPGEPQQCEIRLRE